MVSSLRSAPRPSVSIVMATRNAAKWLPRALASLAGQTLQDYELIVQDAVSTDATLRTLRRFKGPCVVQSEPDKGLYDAWNKALLRVQGDWCLFLGADDMLATPDVLARAVPTCKPVLRRRFLPMACC